jgi:hypothetical protein
MREVGVPDRLLGIPLHVYADVLSRLYHEPSGKLPSRWAAFLGRIYARCTVARFRQLVPIGKKPVTAPPTFVAVGSNGSSACRPTRFPGVTVSPKTLQPYHMAPPMPALGADSASEK